MTAEGRNQRDAQGLGVEIGSPIPKPSHGSIPQAAGHDGAKGLQGTGDVEGQAVLADPALGPHADRSHLAALQPDPRETRTALGRQPIVAEEINHHPFQGPQVTMQIGAMAAQIEDGVKDQLARPMVGDFAAAVDAKQGQRRCLDIKAEVLQAGPTAQGVTGFVLQHDQGLGAVGGLQQALLQLPLPIPGPGEGHRRQGFKKDCGSFRGHHRCS